MRSFVLAAALALAPFAAHAAGTEVDGNCTYTSFNPSHKTDCTVMVGREEAEHIWIVVVQTEFGAMAMRGSIGSFDAEDVLFWKGVEKEPKQYTAPPGSKCQYNFTQGYGSGWCLIPSVLKVDFSGTLKPESAPSAPRPAAPPKPGQSNLEQLRDRLKQ
jgi:hypothetical protein